MRSGVALVLMARILIRTRPSSLTRHRRVVGQFEILEDRRGRLEVVVSAIHRALREPEASRVWARARWRLVPLQNGPAGRTRAR